LGSSPDNPSAYAESDLLSDPEAIVDSRQKVRFHSDCNGASSCTVSSEVSVIDPDTPDMLLKMTVDFSGTKNGAAFASCADTVAVTPGAP
jgi:hypothetical protein